MTIRNVAAKRPLGIIFYGTGAIEGADVDLHSKIFPLFRKLGLPTHEDWWLAESVDRASRAYFGKPAMHQGLGGSIPFMSMLGERFPQAQFLVTGVMGPGSNAHGPNEFIDLPTGVKVTACVAQVLADHWRSAPSARR